MKRKKTPKGRKKAEKKAPAEPETEKVPKEILERRKRLMKEAELALGAVNSYPMLKSRAEVEEAKGRVLEAYARGDAVVKQFILFVVHEHLSRAANARAMENFEFFKKILGEKAEVLDVRKHVYRAMFNYSNSLEGTVELLLLLGEIGDVGAAKVLSRHLAFYMGAEHAAMQMLRNAAVEALEECRCTYALDVLLAYAKYAEKNERFVFALKDWEAKLRKMDIPPADKEEYISAINDLMMVRKEKDVHYG
ncbi:MAG: hypothetical protein AB1657_01870 [Candidatus Micrarchaeota archaeon]